MPERVSTSRPLTVLWDADGVLQHSTGPWRERLDAAGGPGFAEAVFAAEGPALRGVEPFADCLARLLRSWPADITVEELLGLWEDVDVDAEAFGLVGQVRRSGVPCYLATNQQDHRVRFMRTVLGYDAAFDGSFYSSELGVAKPDPAFFRSVLDRVAADLGRAVRPGEVAFLDDSAANVAAATGLGIRAVRHDPLTGTAGLRAQLAEVGWSLGDAEPFVPPPK